MKNNPFTSFPCDQSPHQINLFTKNSEQNPRLGLHDNLGTFRIKVRKIRHKTHFGRGANHPSFFLRKFYSKLRNPTFQNIYKDDPDILEQMLMKADRLKATKKYNLDDLIDTFGSSEDYATKKERYLNSKMFFKAISQNSLEMILQESKCSQILNHLVSMEKYSSRLGNDNLVGRVEFQ